MCQSVNLLVEMGGKSAGRKSASQKICQMGKSVSRFSDCNQICQGGVNLLGHLVTVKKSASQQICWQKWEGKSASIFSICHQICQSVNLPVGLVTVRKSACQ